MTLAVVTAAGASLPARTAPPALKPVVEAAAPEPPPPPLLKCGEPVPGQQIDSPFGLRRMPWERHGRLHEGVDIAAPTGQPVLAVADGIVTRSGESSSYGRYVEVEHGAGLTSFYAHLGRIDRLAKAGAFVERGHSVGRIGSSGTSTGPHLHFEIRQDGKPLNPAAFLGREFQTAEDLPVKAASYVSPRVRVAQVSMIPLSKQALMAEADKPSQSAGKRVRSRIRTQDHPGAPLPVVVADAAD
ncbi:MAG TPA: M23 family metallopeptidase [Phenylobacterium sp.]|nr:M23 family metallopeptidase [Phenylobacterium sp.]